MICILAVTAVVFRFLLFSNSQPNEKLITSLEGRKYQETKQFHTEVVIKSEEAKELCELLAELAAQIEEAKIRIAELETKSLFLAERMSA